MASELPEPHARRYQSALDAYRATFPDRLDARASNWAALSTGWENEMASFDVQYGPPAARRREGLVLRVYPGDDAYTKSEREFRHMRALRDAGYPVPHVLLLDRTTADRPFVIMERIEGRPLWPLLFHPLQPIRSLLDRATHGRAGPSLLSLFCGLLVRLHRMDWRPFADDARGVPAAGECPPYFFVDQWLSVAREMLERFPVAGFQPLTAWLEERRDQAACPRPSVIHGDFHPNNVLVRADGSAVVIDWTNLSVADARYDLAWTLLLVGMYEGERWRRRVLKEYERLSGAPVEHLEFFDVLACASRLFGFIVSLSAGPERLGMHAAAVEAMRRQAGSFRWVYRLCLERTGIRVAEVEDLLRKL